MSSAADRATAPKIATEIALLRALLGDVFQIVKQQAEQLRILVAAREQVASFSIGTFCKRNDISESQYHKLRREGRGPRTMLTGDVSVRISAAAERD
jgi:hypothetical protein